MKILDCGVCNLGYRADPSCPLRLSLRYQSAIILIFTMQYSFCKEDDMLHKNSCCKYHQSLLMVSSHWMWKIMPQFIRLLLIDVLTRIPKRLTPPIQDARNFDSKDLGYFTLNKIRKLFVKVSHSFSPNKKY